MTFLCSCVQVHLFYVFPCSFAPTYLFYVFPCSSASREKCYNQIQAAISKYREIKENVNEGLKFYVTLQVSFFSFYSSNLCISMSSLYTMSLVWEGLEFLFLHYIEDTILLSLQCETLSLLVSIGCNHECEAAMQ